MIAVTVFLLDMNPMEFCWVHNPKENRHCDHIPFNFERNKKSTSLRAVFAKPLNVLLY